MSTYQIQLLLLYLGYEVGAADGICGKATRAAVRAFQGEWGLMVDGIPGTRTCAALRQAVAEGWEQPENVSGPDTAVTGTYWDEIEYFDREEFRCKCGGKYCDGFPAEPAEAAVRAVDEIRRRLGVPVIVTSGLRCAPHNANEGGVSNSQHLTGLAADLHSSATPARMKEVAEEVLGNTGGIGLYDWGIHVDTRANKARWNG